MKANTKLKDDARKHEQGEEWDKALQLYLRVLQSGEDGAAEVELSLYNRVGDLYVRLGRPAEAVTYYEQAAERYGEAGLFNNAIALCNKALRYVPDKVALFRTLGKFCASQGFVTDARRWYLEYAERKFHEHDFDSAFEALEEIAGILEDVEIREMLGRRLHGHQRHDEALDVFRRAYGMRWRAAEYDQAEALKEEVRKLYPDASDAMWTDEQEAAYVGTAHRDAQQAELPALAEHDAAPGSDEADETVVTDEDSAADDDPSATAAGEAIEATSVIAGDRQPPPAGRLEGFEATGIVEDEPAPPFAAIEADDDGAGTAADRDSDFADDNDIDDVTEPLAGLESTSFASAEDDEFVEPLPGLDDFDGEPFDDGAEETEEEQLPAGVGLPLLDSDGEDDYGSSDGETGVPHFDSAAGLPSLAGVLEPGPPVSAPANLANATSDYIDLLDLIGTPEPVQMTRFFVEEQEPTGDEDRDFAELLAQFKAKLAEHVGEEDAGSHYDLGLAFKDMGLIDEAISEFQVALRHGDSRLKIFEELGQCFSMKGQHSIAVKILTRAMQVEHGDDLELIGVFYHLGRAYEETGQAAEARDAFERVIGLDIGFRDVMDRMRRL